MEFMSLGLFLIRPFHEPGHPSEMETDTRGSVSLWRNQVSLPIIILCVANRVDIPPPRIFHVLLTFNRLILLMVAFISERYTISVVLTINTTHSKRTLLVRYPAAVLLCDGESCLAERS